MNRFTGETGKANGFTLVEVLVAVAVTGIIFSFIFGVLSSGISASREAEAGMRAEHVGRFIISRISHDLSSATLMRGSASGFFIGTHEERNGKSFDRLDFTSFARLYYGSRPLIDQSEIGYYFLPRPERNPRLMRREADVIEEPYERGGVAFEVSDMVDEFRLRYLGPAEWVENWDSRENYNLPRAVSVEVRLNDGTKDYFFSTVVRLPA